MFFCSCVGPRKLSAEGVPDLVSEDDSADRRACESLCRGLRPAGLQSVLQALCLTTHSSFDVIEDWVEATLLLPDPRLSKAVCPLKSRTLSRSSSADLMKLST